MNTCFYCENGEKLRSLMIEICELPYSKVYLNRDQKHRGRCIVALKAHKTEYFQLTPEENAGYFGDGVPHVHVHIVPKYQNGLNWGAPFDDTLPKQLLSDGEYGEMVEALRVEILK